MNSLPPKFHNVTLACEEGMYFLTYKVILMAGSAVPGRILRKDLHLYPLIYVKGDDQHLVWGPDGKEDRLWANKIDTKWGSIHWDCNKCEKKRKTFYNYGCHPTPIVRPSTSATVDRFHQGPRRGASTSRLRRRERRVAARAAIDIGGATEETVNVNETTPEAVEETEHAENAKNTEKSVNAIRAAGISISNWTE